MVRTTLVAALLASWCQSALALNPALDVSQYAHTAWKIRDGYFKGYITSFAQTADGYLWLGSEFGLMRFDGVRFVAWQPPTGQSLPTSYIRSLLAASDGTLWIGTMRGMASLKDGTLTRYQQLDGQTINALLEGREGTVWIGSSTVSNEGRLCAVRKSILECEAGDGRWGSGIFSLYQDRSGTLWVEAMTGLWRWKPGPPRLHRLASALMVTLENLAEDDDGTLLIGGLPGIQRLAAGSDEAEYLRGRTRQLDVTRLRRDRDGGLWIGTADSGLFHLHEGRLDQFAQAEGLSASLVNRLFEDREGNIWVATAQGLDRFRELAVRTMTVKQGLSSDSVASVQASTDHSVWLATAGGLNRWMSDHVQAYGNPRARVARSSEHITSLFQSPRGRIWVATLDGLVYVQSDRLISVDGTPAGNLYSFAEDAAGNLWFANQEHGLVRLSSHHDLVQIPWARLGRSDHAVQLLADGMRGGLWLGFFEGGIAYFADGEIRASYGVADGLGEGFVSDLQLDQDGALWVSTGGGLSRLKDGRVTTLTSRNGLPCDGVHWLIKDDTDSVWLYTVCGLVRMPRSDLDAWSADPKRAIQAMVFDVSDGVRLISVLGAGGYTPRVTKASDGRLWFLTGDGVSVLDPRHLPFNRLPPPVQIERITADRRGVELDAARRATLPALTRDLEIEYTALSLVAPEKNQFRYKLEGFDSEWQDVGNRRQAYYTNLPPRNYRFRVVASNNSGVWNETGAALDFSIAPAYYQTTWFRASAVIAALALLWAAYQYRVRQLAHVFDARLQERVNERTRIARELHDTLLQSFHGLLFRFQAANNLLPDRVAEAQQHFEHAIDQAAQAIAEGRDAVQNLRASTSVTNDLAEAISTLGAELAAAQTPDTKTKPAVVDVAVEGTSRDLHPIVRDDIYRIAGEALRNAFRHARARHIEVRVRYDDDRLQVRVRDDGTGIDAAVRDDQRPGHFGLPGMRERAELAGGHLTVWSEVGLGTEVELTIPAAAAYATPRARGRAWLFTKRASTRS
ncbi:MAG TPA: two-component regulator propeller domain-containing protein [Vicinamibacterales bacterium]|nr:two-component regulator propeller domain-containing protein [Vicinamibacterales bacterium]